MTQNGALAAVPPSDAPSATQTQALAGQVTPVQKAMSAISGAVITSLIVTPLDVVKTRLQAQDPKAVPPICCKEGPAAVETATAATQTTASSSALRRPQTNVWRAASASTATARQRPRVELAACGPEVSVCVAEETSMRTFSGTWEGLVKISKAEGVSSLWRGLSPTLFMAIPSTVIYFVGYEQLRSLVDADAAWAPLLCGGIARTASATVIGPLELLRTRLQGVQARGKTASETFREVVRGIRANVKSDGARSLWRGLSLTLWRDVPFSALYWLGYERVKLLAQARTDSPFLQSFAAGGISGTIAALATTPFDVAKTRKQVLEHDARLNLSTPALLKRIHAQDGLQGLWRGTIPRCLKVAPACAIMISSYELGKRFFGQRVE